MSRQAFSRIARIDIFISTGFAFTSAVSTVFVSMYLYRWLGNLATLTLFNLGQFVLMPFGFVLAALIARKLGNKSSLGIGLALFLIFYGLLIALGQYSAKHLVELGILNGIANGFYWFPFNLITAQAAEESEKGRFYGVSGVLTSVATALGPLVSTLAISLAPRIELGYSWLFAAIALVLAVMALMAFTLPKDEAAAPLRILRYLHRGIDERWRFCLDANFAYGIRDGASWSIASILILQSAGSEKLAGYLAIGFAIIGALASHLAGRLFSQARASGIWLVGAVSVIVGSLVISLFPSLTGALVFGTLSRIADCIIVIPFNVVFLGALAHYQNSEGSGAGRNIATEIAINSGRSIGTLAFLVLSFITADYARILLPLVALGAPASWLIFRRYAKSGNPTLV